PTINASSTETASPVMASQMSRDCRGEGEGRLIRNQVPTWECCASQFFARSQQWVFSPLTSALSPLRGENPPDFVRALRPVTSRELFWPAWTTKGCLP